MGDFGMSSLGSTFGAQVVTKTLNNLNGLSGGPAPVDSQTFGAAVVSKTLDVMNSGSMSNTAMDRSMAGSFDFQTSVLSAAYTGKGTLVDGNF